MQGVVGHSREGYCRGCWELTERDKVRRAGPQGEGGGTLEQGRQKGCHLSMTLSAKQAGVWPVSRQA